MKNKYNEIISSLSDKELLYHLYLTQAIILVISLFLGWILFDEFSFLDHFRLNDPNILKVGFTAGIGVVIFDIVMMKWLPRHFYNDGGLNERIFKKRNTFHIIFIAAVVAFSEELLFRGIIQTSAGLMLASIIFAIIHYRYLFNLYLFVNIVLLSFLIGLIYEWTGNFAVTIMMHFVIDFCLGIYIKYTRSPKMEDE
ncbi:type II CAAX endopeptidase family protein [Neobacillus mesonae]|uniref:CPBP family intramembrane glutamic endopeptidase n=1 Tax=Neobacillus mesonae TaxID=1193713 RepID=UPI002E20E0EA|nr:type II CAAX endopeptidase family protein [Neobacillus mesonae]